MPLPKVSNPAVIENSAYKEYVKDVMNPDPHTINQKDCLHKATKEMVKHDCGFLIAIDDLGKAVGVLTDRDIVVYGIADDKDLKETQVSELMTKDIITCYKDELLEVAADHISANDIRRLVVLDDADNLAGVISLVDMIKHVEDDTINFEVIKHLFKYA